MKFKALKLFIILLLSATVLVAAGFLITSKLFNADDTAFAATVQELQSQIDSHANTIKQLEEEIAKYTEELNKTSSQAKTLQTTVQGLDINAKKIGTDIAVTSNKIESTNLTIDQLKNQISEKELNILKNKQALSNSLRKINESDSRSLMETFLTYPKLADFWTEVEAQSQFQNKVKEHLGSLITFKTGLEVNKSQEEKTKEKLMLLKNQLADQKTLVEVTKAEKAKLLAETKNQESTYKQILADKVAKKKAFEKELLQYESQLKFAIDPNSIPSSKPGVLSWPTERRTVTQYFGNTAFATANAQIYNGNGHNGIDIGVPIGSSIMSAQTGTVLGTGDTDTVCPGASYGKWVFVQHTNGLSTLYAHLSVIKVSQGQKVNTGDLLGYSGSTGYSTGPHLHFTVYASQGVKIISRPSVSCGGGVYTIPVADLKAYLNPMSYL